MEGCHVATDTRIEEDERRFFWLCGPRKRACCWRASYPIAKGIGNPGFWREFDGAVAGAGTGLFQAAAVELSPHARV